MTDTNLTTEESLSTSTTVTVQVQIYLQTILYHFKSHQDQQYGNIFCHYKQSTWYLLCKKVLSYNGGTTSNLIQYLKKKHQSQVVVQKAKTTEDTIPKQLLIMQFGKLQKGKSINRLCSVET